MLVVIDYGMGNLRSVLKALNRIKCEAIVSSDHSVIRNANKLLLPGVGNFKKGIENLKSLNLFDVIKQEVDSGKPILGICLGMQLMTLHSEEGNVDGLGFIEASTKSFSKHSMHTGLKYPHMGWNTAKIKSKCSITNEILNESEYYFVHSYFVDCKNKSDVVMKTSYGREFVSCFRKKNIQRS